MNSAEAKAAIFEALGWRFEDGILARPAWHARAACRGVGPELFFPDRGDSAWAYGQAREMHCAHCPVVSECRQAGEHEAFGLWGGQTAGRRH